MTNLNSLRLDPNLAKCGEVITLRIEHLVPRLQHRRQRRDGGLLAEHVDISLAVHQDPGRQALSAERVAGVQDRLRLLVLGLFVGLLLVFDWVEVWRKVTVGVWPRWRPAPGPGLLVALRCS